jgi:hypothetical protein
MNPNPLIKSFGNLLELIKGEIKADANQILCTSRRALTRVDKVPGVTQRWTRVTIERALPSVQ